MKRTEKGTFAAGNAGGLGRPKGSKNKADLKLRQFVDDFINDNRDKLQSDFDSLDPKERIDSLIKLLDYSLPKLSRTEISRGEDFKSMTDEELDAKLAEYGVGNALPE